jgi:hypothetical protein
MEWLISILTIVFTPLLTLLGIVVTEKYKAKTKKMELDMGKNEALEAIKAQFNAKLESLSNKLDDIIKDQTEIKTEQLRTSLYVTQLQKDVQKHNGVIERTMALEKQVAVLDNREKVSEHRLDDLEKIS